MHQRASETARSTRDSKFQEQPSIDASPHRPEAIRCADKMRDRYSRDCEPGVELKREDWSEQAADSKPGNRRNNAGDYAGHSDGDGIEIKASRYRCCQGVSPSRGGSTTICPSIIGMCAGMAQTSTAVIAIPPYARDSLDNNYWDHRERCRGIRPPPSEGCIQRHPRQSDE
jgi:hypothetical protein